MSTTDIFINETKTSLDEDGNLDGQIADGPASVKQRLSDDYNQLDEPILDTLLRDLKSIYYKMKIIALPLSSYDIYKVVLRGWDLWGPLLLCTFLAFNLHHSENHPDKHSGPQFADVFVLVWFGSCIVSVNYRLLSISSLNNQTLSKQVHRLFDPTTSKDSQQFDEEQHKGPATRGDQAGQVSFQGINSSGQKMMFKREESASGTHHTLLSPPSIFQLMCVFGYCLIAPCFGLLLLKIFSLDRLFFERAIVGLIFGFAWPTVCSIRILIRYQHPDKRALAIYPIGLFYLVLSCIIILNH